jgi:hypothetical protein
MERRMRGDHLSLALSPGIHVSPYHHFTPTITSCPAKRLFSPKCALAHAACVWSLSTGKRALCPLQHEGALVTATKFHQTDLLATTAQHDSIHVYDSQNGRLLVDVPIQVNSKQK